MKRKSGNLKSISDLLGGAKKSSEKGSMFIPLVLVIGAFVLFKSYYTVPSDSIALIQRFGEYRTETQSGLHFKIPLVDVATILPVKRQMKQEFGFATPGATNRYQTAPDMGMQKDMVTGDLNAVQVEWVVQYRIAEPTKYLFKVRRPDETLRDVSESVMREVVGDRTVDEVLTIGRQEIENESLQHMQTIAARYELGISIDQVQLKNVNPPAPVQASFNEVNQAQQEKERLINEARREYNKVVPLAEGEKDQRIRAADGYRLKRINEAEGDASRFKAVLAEYIKAPEVTRKRIYLETMEEVLPGFESKIILDDEGSSLLPLLHLNKSTQSLPENVSQGAARAN